MNGIDILHRADHMKVVGLRLRQLIAALGLKQVEAARQMDIPKNQLGNWLRGEAYPIHYSMYRFCRVNGIGIDWVFLGDPGGLPHRLSAKLLQLEPEPAKKKARGSQESESAAPSNISL